RRLQTQRRAPRRQLLPKQCRLRPLRRQLRLLALLAPRPQPPAQPLRPQPRSRVTAVLRPAVLRAAGRAWDVSRPDLSALHLAEPGLARRPTAPDADG